MVYVNIILVLIIAYLVTKLYMEHKEMRKSINTRKARAINLSSRASQLK